MDGDESQADGETRKPDRSAFLRDAEDADEEQDGACYLVDECRKVLYSPR